MTVAKMRGIVKRTKKKVKALFFPPAGTVPGQMDYPVMPEVLKRKKKLKELTEG